MVGVSNLIQSTAIVVGATVAAPRASVLGAPATRRETVHVAARAEDVLRRTTSRVAMVKIS